MPRIPPKRRASNGSGTITSLSSTKHLVRIPIGFYANGQVKYKTHTVNGTKKEAQQLRTKLLHQVNSGFNIAPEKKTINVYLNYWLEAIVKRTKRPATYQLYAKLIRLHLAPHIGHIQVTKLTRAQVQTVANAKLDSGLSVATVQRTVGVLRNALNHLVEGEDLVRNPAVGIKLPKAIHPKPKAMTQTEAVRFLSAARQDRLAAAWFLSILGLREGELLGLRRSRDINLQRKVLFVRGQLSMATGKPVLDAATKTEGSVRMVPLPDAVVAMLDLHFVRQDEERRWNAARWQEHDLVFCSSIGTPLRPRSFLRWFHELLDRAQIERRRFHDLRHSCASLLRALKVDPKFVQALVGHSRAEQTDDYTTVYDESIREAVGLFDHLYAAALVDEQSDKKS